MPNPLSLFINISDQLELNEDEIGIMHGGAAALASYWAHRQLSFQVSGPALVLNPNTNVCVCVCVCVVR